MQNQPVHWAEGLFLRPHHLQATDRYWHELLSTSSQFDHPYNYGLSKVKVNQNALDNQVFELTSCHARFREGTILAFDSSKIDRVNLIEKLESDPSFAKFLRESLSIKVFLGIPQLRLGRVNVGAGNDTSRYLETLQNFDDETTGGNPQELKFKDLNVKILFETDDLSGFETLPICRLYKSSEMDGQLDIDPRYYPPVLTTNASGFLDQKIMKEAFDLLSHRADYLKRWINERGISFSSQIAGATERLLLLQAINESIGTLSCIAFSAGVHPFDAYTRLCEIIGRLSVFGSEKSCSDIPKYDHDDLYTIFNWALERIRALINLGEEGYVQRFFKGDGGPRLRVSLETSWFTPSWNLYLGIHSPEHSAKECLRVLDSEVTWKIASSEQVDFCFEKHARGLKLRLPKQQPAELPSDSGWTFFAMNEDDRWDSVVETASIAIRINSKQIHNLNDLENNQLVILQTDNTRMPIELALFAIKAGGN